MAVTSLPTIMQTLPLFSGLSEHEKNAVTQSGNMRRYTSGDRVFLYGDRIEHFYIILEGAVQLYRETPDGHEMTTDVLIAGDTIGETEILQSGTTHQFNALAVKETALMEFPTNWLKENVKRHPILALNLLSMLSRRAHIATVEAEHKTTMSAAQQISCFLERLCVLHDFDPKGFQLPYSKTLIASRLGMELETFSRALSKIRDHGIAVKGMNVAFTNFEKMEHFACSHCSIAGDCPEHEALKAQSQTPQRHISQAG